MIKVVIITFYSFILVSCSSKSIVKVKSTKVQNKNEFAHKKRIVKRVGILLNNESLKEESDLILKGLKISMNRIKSSFKGKFFIVKTRYDKKSIKKSLEKLINIRKVSVVISWGDRKFLESISKMWPSYMKPTIFITSLNFKNKNIYTVSPNFKSYGQRLIGALTKRNIKKIAILTPNKYKNSKFLNQIKKEMKHGNIEVVFDEEYFSENFYSMDKACEKIFVIDENKRKKEFEAILKEEESKANLQGFELNRKHVFLPAKINFDAIFIPDNFRSVKHFVKLFEYYKARGVILIGTHEWRSESLLSTRDQLLEGALFVDFVGNYNQIPFYKKAKSTVAPKMIVSPDESVQVDYSLMGFYAGLLSQIAVNTPYRPKNMRRFLNNLKLNDEFLGKRKAFAGNRFNWPTFLFEIRNNKFNLTKI